MLAIATAIAALCALLPIPTRGADLPFELFRASLDVKAAALLFIGTIQGLVMQSLMAGNVARIRHDAPKVFAIYRRGISHMEKTKRKTVKSPSNTNPSNTDASRYAKSKLFVFYQ